MHIWTEAKIFSLQLLKIDHTFYLSSKNNFVLNLCNKLNSFLTQTKYPIQISTSLHFFAVLEEGSSKYYFFPDVVFSFYLWYLSYA